MFTYDTKSLGLLSKTVYHPTDFLNHSLLVSNLQNVFGMKYWHTTCYILYQIQNMNTTNI